MAPTASRYVNEVNYLFTDLTQTNPFLNLENNKFSYVLNAGGYVNHSSLRDGGMDVIEQHFNSLVKLVNFLDWNYLIKFINIGSSDEYGHLGRLASEHQREQPISPYSLSKMAASHFLQMMHFSQSFPSITLRLFLTYGPGQNVDRFIPQIVLGCLSNKKFPVSEGKQIRDFCFIDDVVEAVFLSLFSTNMNGSIINIASGKKFELRRVVELIMKLTQKGSPQFGELSYRTNESMELFGKVDKAMNKLGWEPKISLEEGLRQTIDWYQENG